MSRATVRSQIARIDALSRTRALDEGESRQLQKLIAVDRRYDYLARTNVASPRARKPRSQSTIVARLDDTLARMSAEQFSVRAIYLTTADRAELAAAGALDVADGLSSYRGFPVRRTMAALAVSRIWSTHGIGRTVRRNGG